MSFVTVRAGRWPRRCATTGLNPIIFAIDAVELQIDTMFVAGLALNLHDPNALKFELNFLMFGS